jgi:hypothetical protein
VNCEVCGTELPHGAMFCGECGRAVWVRAVQHHPDSGMPIVQPTPTARPASDARSNDTVAIDPFDLDSLAWVPAVVPVSETDAKHVVPDPVPEPEHYAPVRRRALLQEDMLAEQDAEQDADPELSTQAEASNGRDGEDTAPPPAVIEHEAEAEDEAGPVVDQAPVFQTEHVVDAERVVENEAAVDEAAVADAQSAEDVFQQDLPADFDDPELPPVPLDPPQAVEPVEDEAVPEDEPEVEEEPGLDGEHEAEAEVDPEADVEPEPEPEAEVEPESDDVPGLAETGPEEDLPADDLPHEPEPADLRSVDPAPPVLREPPLRLASVSSAPDPFPWGEPSIPLMEEPDDLEQTLIVARRDNGERFVLQFSTGESVTVSGTGLLGRNPVPQPGEYFDQLVSISDPGKSVSKTHLEFGQESAAFWVSDRFSGNGSVVREPGMPPKRLASGKRYRIVRGSRVDIGEQFFVVS